MLKQIAAILLLSVLLFNWIGYHDSIEFFCIPDGAANRLRSAKDDFFRLVNDLQKSGHPKFPGPSGKTNPLVNKIFWCETYYFPNLHYFAACPALSPRFLRVDLAPGHPRIGLPPPRQDIPLS